MESKCKIDTNNIAEIVNDMITAKFNDHNPLINDIRNHVVIESSIEREIPQVHNKIDLIAAQQAAIGINESYDDVDIDVNINQNTNQYIHDNLNNEPQSENIQTNDESHNNIMNIAKLTIILLAIIAVVCWYIYMYVNNKYKYIMMACVVAAGLASDYYISKKYCWF